MVRSSLFLLNNNNHSFRGFFYIPTTLALITSLYIVLYIYSTSHIFSAHHYKPHFLIKSPHGSSNSSFQSHNFVKSPDYRPPRSDFLVPELVHHEPLEQSSFNEESVEVSWPPETEPLFVGLNGKHVNKEVFHDKELFLEDYKEMNRSFKIYVYPHREDDPFAHVFSPVDSEPGGNYASESYFKMVLMKSHFITKDPSEADLFFMPFSITRLRHDPRVSVGGIPDFVKSYVYNITQNYPYWNRSGGADHFYVACHSIGRSAMDKAEEVKYNSIQVVCSSSYYLSGYIAHKDVSLPQIWTRNEEPPEVNLTDRKKLAFFAGSMNSPVRAELIETWRNDSEIFVNSGRLKTPYSDAMLGSKFCLHVKGFEVNTARVVDALYYGCVPVIIANYYDLPFADILNWKSFSVVVATLDIPLLKKILQEVVDDEYETMQGNVMKVRNHFRWNLIPVDYDSFYMVMYELWIRRSAVIRIPLSMY